MNTNVHTKNLDKAIGAWEYLLCEYPFTSQFCTKCCEYFFLVNPKVSTNLSDETIAINIFSDFLLFRVNLSACRSTVRPHPVRYRRDGYSERSHYHILGTDTHSHISDMPILPIPVI